MNILSEIIGYPLGWIMWLMYQITNNYAFSIVLFTLITKIILFPLSIKQQKSTAAMTAMQPKLDKLKKQYGNNQEKYNEATMQLYSEEGVNPMASCLPLLIQFPILYGIFDVVYRPISHILRIDSDTVDALKQLVIDNTAYDDNKYFEHRPEIYIVKAIKEAVANGTESIYAAFPDAVDQIANFKNTLFGVVELGDIPTLKPEVWNVSAFVLIMIPVFSGLFQLASSVYSQVRQKKLNPDAPKNPSMTMMMFGMPIFAIWIAFGYPAAIGFYWSMSALFSLLQQVILNKIYTPEYVAKLVEKDKLKKKNKKKSGIMERYQQILAEQQGNQNGGKPANSKIEASGVVVDDDGEVKDIKLSKSKQKEYERALIREARRRQAEKYGEVYEDNDED